MLRRNLLSISAGLSTLVSSVSTLFLSTSLVAGEPIVVPPPPPLFFGETNLYCGNARGTVLYKKSTPECPICMVIPRVTLHINGEKVLDVLESGAPAVDIIADAEGLDNFTALLVDAGLNLHENVICEIERITLGTSK